MKMSCIVFRAFVLFTDAKDKRFTCNVLLYCGQKSTKKDKIVKSVKRQSVKCTHAVNTVSIKPTDGFKHSELSQFAL